MLNAQLVNLHLHHPILLSIVLVRIVRHQSINLPTHILVLVVLVGRRVLKVRMDPLHYYQLIVLVLIVLVVNFKQQIVLKEHHALHIRYALQEILSVFKVLHLLIMYVLIVRQNITKPPIHLLVLRV